MKFWGIVFVLYVFAPMCYGMGNPDFQGNAETFINNDEIKLEIPSKHLFKDSHDNEKVIPCTPMEYLYLSKIDEDNESAHAADIYNHSLSLYGQKVFSQVYSLPPRAKVLYSKKGLHPNAYTQGVSMLANGLVLNQELDNVIFDKETEANDNSKVWFKPVNSIEGNLLNSSVYVSNNFYGGAAGVDSEVYQTPKNAFVKYGLYGAVIDSISGYRGIDLMSNGVVAGGYISRFKNKSFAVLNAKVNYNAHEASGQYGTDDYQSLLGGVSLKAGSNIPLFKDKVCLQHYHVYSYIYGHGYSYENAAGMQVGGTDLNNFWTTHGVKIFANKEEGLKPYLNAGMAINLFGNGLEQTIDNNTVNSLKLNNYFVCSAGIQKEIKDRFLGFVEVSAKAPGRIYMNTYFGLKWKI